MPTKDQSSLKDLQIVVLVQFPVLTSEIVSASDEQGNKVTTSEIRAKLGITKHIETEHMLRHADMVTFRTEYVSEIPLYDVVDDSVVK